MENQSIIKKILSFIANLFKVIIIIILNIIRGIFGKKKTQTNNNIQSINNEHNIDEKKQSSNIGSTSGLPDEDNIKNNQHDNNDDNEDTTNDILLDIPKYKLNNLNKKIDENKIDILTYELVSELIDKELEEIYKEDKFKVKDASKEIEEKIKDLKEKVIPKIVEKINDNKLTTKDEVKKEVKEVLEIELKEKPILVKPIKKDEPIQVNKSKEEPLPNIPTKKSEDIENKITNSISDLNNNISIPPIVSNELENNKVNKDSSNKDIYFVAMPRKKELKINENKPFKAKKEDKIIEVANPTVLDQKMENSPVKMVQNVTEIPKPSIKDKLTNAAIASTIIAADITREMFSSPKEENNKRTQSNEKNQTNQQAPQPTQEAKQETTTAEALNIPGIKDVDQVKNELEHDTKSVEELVELQNKLENKIEQLKKDDEKKKDSTKEAQEVVKDLIKDTEISAITQTSDSIIDESIAETRKEEFEDKDYDRIERQLDKMLEDISNTYLRYEDKMTPKQKAKLEIEETKLRNAREHIRSCKDKDIAVEQRLLEEDITSREITGLQDELKRLDEENKKEANNQLLSKLDKMENMTKEQVANVDKRILNKRLKKASFLLEMSSILAFPFIRNKYFLYFTAGLIIDNHFNFINSFFNRKLNKYEPADLSQIRRGQDALDGALDVTYKNLVQLEYIEQKALSRYPELAYDPQFIHQVTSIKTKLNHNYNKLMRKNKMMDKYYSRTKQQKKILKKDLKSEQK